MVTLQATRYAYRDKQLKCNSHEGVAISYPFDGKQASTMHSKMLIVAYSSLRTLRRNPNKKCVAFSM